MTNYVNNQPVVYNSDLGIYERGEGESETEYGKSESIKTVGKFEPRGGVSYQSNEASYIKASYAKPTQYLHLLSNTSSVTSLDVWTPSGKYIKSQISNRFAMGY